MSGYLEYFYAPFMLDQTHCNSIHARLLQILKGHTNLGLLGVLGSMAKGKKQQSVQHGCVVL